MEADMSYAAEEEILRMEFIQETKEKYTANAQIDSQAAPDPSIAPYEDRSLWWTLPLEIRDEIYGMAYCVDRVFKVVARQTWAERQTIRRIQEEQAYMPTPFPGNPLAASIVSKEWKFEAFRVFFSQTKFRAHYAEELLCLLHVPPGYRPRRESCFIRSFQYEGLQVHETDVSELVEYCPGLKHLTIIIVCHRALSSHQDSIDKWAGDPYSTAWAAINGHRAPILRPALAVRGLSSFAIRTVEEKGQPLGNNIPEDATLIANLQVVEQKMREIVTLPKGSPLPPDETTAQLESKAASPPSPLARPLPPSLQDRDVPLAQSQFRKLLESKPDELMSWLADAKWRLAH